MRKSLVRFMALSIVMLLMIPGLVFASGEVGTPAPDFDLMAHGGGSHNLSQYLGQVLALFIIGYG